jgi:hypothetical protein
MNNKPVAWMLNGIIHECDPSDWAKEQYPDQDVIPLYTQNNTRLHPFKTLPDEEIVEIFTYEYGKSDYYSDTHQWAIEFARAILKKASEK